MQWIKTKVKPLTQEIKDENDNIIMEVIGFHPDWIDLDFNPNGTRVGFIGGEGEFISAYWWDEQDCYRTSDEISNGKPFMPTYYMLIPKHP